MKRIIFSLLLGLSVLCPVQSMFSLSKEDEARIAQIDKEIKVLDDAIARKKGGASTRKIGNKTVTFKRKFKPKYDQPIIDRWEKDKAALEAEKANLKGELDI